VSSEAQSPANVEGITAQSIGAPCARWVSSMIASPPALSWTWVRGTIRSPSRVTSKVISAALRESCSGNLCCVWRYDSSTVLSNGFWIVSSSDATFSGSSSPNAATYFTESVFAAARRANSACWTPSMRAIVTTA